MTKQTTLWRYLAITLLLTGLVITTPAQKATPTPPAQNPAPVRVTLLQVNDVYQFTPVDRGTRGGLGRILTLRKQIQAASPNTLLLMAGDTISPSVETLTYKGAQMIDAWNAIGLDYAVFGNHEFDLGPEVLAERVKQSRFPWLSANVINQKTGATFAGSVPYVVREVGGVKIGLLGLVLPETKTTSKPGPDAEFLDVCETANKYVPQMLSEGAGVIIALTHLSLREDKELARCADIDLIIGGHEHTLQQSFAGHAPIFKMTADAREMGQFDLYINPNTNRLESLDWQVHAITDATPEDATFTAAMSKYKDFLAGLSKIVGRTKEPLDARSAANRQQETNIGSFIADTFRIAVTADVALVNGGSIRADEIIAPGPLTERDVVSLLPYADPLLKLQVSGATLRAVLEHGLARVAPNAEPGAFPQVSGVRFVYDAKKPAGSRLVSVTVSGKPLDDSKTYTLATSRFVAEGGDSYAMLKDAPRLNQAETAPKTTVLLRTAIANAKLQTIAPMTDGRIKKVTGNE